MSLCYVVDPSNDQMHVGKEISQPIFSKQTTAMIVSAYDKKDGPKGFDSARQLVDIVHRVFGDCVEHIVLNSWFRSMNSLAEIYWPHTARMLELDRMYAGVNIPHVDSMPLQLEIDIDKDHRALLMTPERTAYRTDHDLDDFKVAHVTQHMLKIYEIFDASEKQLPRLQSIELNLHTYCWDDVLPTTFKATNRSGVLWVDWEGVQCEFYHRFDGFDRHTPESDSESEQDLTAESLAPSRRSLISGRLRAPLASLRNRVQQASTSFSNASQ